MGKNQSASNLTNIIKQDASGNITFVSGSTTLMSVSSSGAITTTGVISGSNALSASYAVNATSASYAATSSYASAFNVAGTLTATTLVVQTVTSSVIYSSGSNVFGNNIANTQTFTGSMNLTGSLTVVTTGTEFQVNATGIKFGNVSTDSHSITGSLLVSGSTHSIFGNVVLGNTSSINASARLEVKGDLFLTPSSSIASMIHLYNKDSTNETYIYDSGSSSNSALTFSPGGTTRMTINSAGNIGIGTISPTTKLTINDTGVYGSALNLVEGTFGAWVQGSTEGLTHAFIGNFKYNFTTPASSFSYYSGTGYGIDMCDGVRFFSAQSNVTNGTFTPTERMRITSGGVVCIGTTTILGGGGSEATNGLNVTSTGVIVNNSNADAGIYLAKRSGFTSSYYIAFYVANSFVGSISTNGTTTSYNTSSDYRLKEDFKESKGLEKVSAIKIYNYKWKSCDERMDGVLAHELAKVIPYAVNGEKDGEQMQGVDYSKLIPVLTKAIQELKAEIDELKNR